MADNQQRSEWFNDLIGVDVLGIPGTSGSLPPVDKSKRQPLEGERGWVGPGSELWDPELIYIDDDWVRDPTGDLAAQAAQAAQAEQAAALSVQNTASGMTENDARFIASKIGDQTLIGDDAERAFSLLEEWRRLNPSPDRGMIKPSDYALPESDTQQHWFGGESREHFDVNAAVEDLYNKMLGRTPSAEKEKVGFVERYSEDLKQRGLMLQDIEEATRHGEQDYPVAMAQVVGKVGFGAVWDFLGESLISGFRGAGEVLDVVGLKDPIVGTAATASDAFLSTDLGMKGLKAAQQGMEKWSEFKADHPKAARNIEAATNILLLVAPVRSSATTPTPKHGLPYPGWASVRPPVSRTEPISAIGRAGEAVSESGRVAAEINRQNYVNSLIRLPQTQAVREKQVARTTVDPLTRTWSRPLTTIEQTWADEIAKIPTVVKTKGPQANYNAIKKVDVAEAERLIAMLAENDFKIFFGEQLPYGVQAVKRKGTERVAANVELERMFNKALDKVMAEQVFVGDAASKAKKLLEKVWQLIGERSKEHGGKFITGSDLLRVRKDLDKWVKKGLAKEGQAFNLEIENAMSLAVREIRMAINNFIAKNAPKAEVKQSLAKQTRLKSAMDRIKPKAAALSDHALMRMWQRMVQLLPIRNTAIQTMAAVGGYGGLGAAALFSPFLTRMAYTAGSGILTYKFLVWPKLRTGLGKLMQGVDDMMAKTADSNLHKEFLGYKVLLLELLKTSEMGAEDFAINIDKEAIAIDSPPETAPQPET